MKYYEFTEVNNGIKTFAEIAEYLFLLPFIFVFVYFNLVGRLNLNIPEVCFPAGLLIVFITGVVLFICNKNMLKGVFVYDDHIEIRYDLLQIFYRNIPFENIYNAYYVQNFRADKDARFGRYNRNLLAGNADRHCVKLYLKHGGFRFVGVEDALGLYKELSKGVYGYGEGE